MKIPYRYIYQDADRHGGVRIYYWRGKGQPKIRIREEPGTEAFAQRYQQLLIRSEQDELVPQGQAPTVRPDTFRWMCVAYFKSAGFKRLGPTTRHVRRQVIEAMCHEPVHPGAQETYADFPLPRLTTKALRVLRDRKADLPEAGNVRVKALRQMLKWALGEDIVTSNPARDLDRLEYASEGHHSWTIEEIKQFEACHPVGSKARLALCLLMWTGVRRSDVVRLGRQHARGGVLTFTPVKNARRKPVRAEIPILPELQRAIDSSPTGDMTYLVTKYGKPFTAPGFGNKFRQWCNEAGLPHCSAHGLRKAGAATAAENGATSQQLMAIFVWCSLAEAERYTRAASKGKLAREAMHLLVNRDK